ncbi:MAG: alanine racemase [Parvularculaceae bacterium]
MSNPPAVATLPSVEIDLDAVCANYRMLAAAAPGAETAAVVKCDGYGLGAGPIARALAAREKCRTFFVTYPHEGAALRAALGDIARDAVIYVFNGPDLDSLAAFQRHALTPVLNSIAQAEFWSRTGAGSPAALHVDTGMNRLGAPAEDLGAIAALGLDLDLVMSHLACASARDDAMNERQRIAFERSAALFPNIRRSLAASGGALLGAAYHYELIRPGLALYGVGPFDIPDPRIRPVATLTAPVIQLRDIKTGETAGYGATWKARSAARLATVTLGYGDGFPRSGANRATALLGGAPCPIAGRVSMDLIILDVSKAPQPVEIGDRAEFFGSRVRIEDAAAACGTIGYELLTGLGARVLRRYVSNGALGIDERRAEGSPR